MEREILFRAKAINRIEGFNYRTDYKNGDWVYGLISDMKNFYGYAQMTNTEGVSGIDVDRETLGQFTGKCDKNGKKIFEGDIVNWYGEILIVRFGEHNVVEQSYEFGNHFRNVDKFGWFGERQKNMTSKGIDLKLLANGEVIGNIYDNPELLEGV